MPAQVEPAPEPQWSIGEIPTTQEWKPASLAHVGVSLRLPPGAHVEPEGGGDDDYTGLYFSLVLASEKSVYFAERNGWEGTLEESIASRRDNGFGRFAGLGLKTEEFAVVLREQDGGIACWPMGCARIGTRRVCTSGDASKGEELATLTKEECLMVLAAMSTMHDAAP